MADANPKSGVRFCRPAPAKVNLFLHIKGRRADGYHELESLVVFTDICDRIEVEEIEGLELVISGPFANGLPCDDGNLIVQAARLLAQAAGITPHARIHLWKALPVSAGIGGGSADAAATLLALRDLWQISMDDEVLHELATQLGADVPVCLAQSPKLVGGIGHDLKAVTQLPAFALLLANPRQPLSSAQVFRSFSTPFTIRRQWDRCTAQDFFSRLVECQNDLETPACKLTPVVSEVLAELDDLPGRRLVRMSGAGATCFALFDDLATARSAAQNLLARRQNWWVQASLIREARS